MTKEEKDNRPRIFASRITAGDTIKDAGAKAGYSERYILSFGKKLLHSRSVVMEMERLRLEVERDGLRSGEDIVKMEKAAIFKALRDTLEDEEESTMGKLKAIEIINKMMGWNEPDKLEIQNSIRDDEATTVRKAERVLVERGWTCIAPKNTEIFVVR